MTDDVLAPVTSGSRGALQSAVLHAFGPGGPLAAADARYVPREVQLQMACAVAGSFVSR